MQERAGQLSVTLEDERPSGKTANKSDSTESLPVASVALLAATLQGCGGGGTSIGESSTPSAPLATNTPAPVSDSEASRFLAQASMGASAEELASVKALGYAGWLNAQFSLQTSQSRWDALRAAGFDAALNRNTENGFDAAVWRKILSSPDTLRQRVTLALSEITVAAIDGLVGGGWKAFAAAAYFDLLETNAFGNYRTLLGQLSTNAAMGQFLTFRGNTKFNATTGALPDENYAREIMQLFSIGLVQLNPDGTPKLVNGVAQDTYTLDDITGLARIFTGWDFDLAGKDTSTPDFLQRPMIQIASRHETGASTFLGATVPAGLSGTDALKAALDIIFGHPNVAPFISRQLIQRLVTSNPTAAYVARVAAVFKDDGTGVAGNLKAVISAILLDEDARKFNATSTSGGGGKMREPILRLANWARAFSATSPSNAWNIGNTSDPASRLGQSPGRSPSVFNFFRPGYSPPNSPVSAAGLVAPEFQLTNESTVVGYINFMQRVVSTGIDDIKGNYTALLAIADTAQPLLDQINLLLAAGQVSSATLLQIATAVDAMPKGTDSGRLNRIYAAITLILAAPEYLVLK